MGTYEEGELTTGFIFTFYLACWLCCIMLFRASHWFGDCICHSVQPSFAHSLFCALYLPVPSFLLSFYPSYLCSQADRACLRCRSYHWEVAWRILSIGATTYHQSWYGELSRCSHLELQLTVLCSVRLFPIWPSKWKVLSITDIFLPSFLVSSQERARQVWMQAL